MPKRALLIAIGLGAALTVIGACVAPRPAPATPAPPATGPRTVLRVGTGDSGEGLTPHFKIIEQFEAANPDIQVQLEPVGSGDYYARILAQIASGDPPDILQIGDDAVPMFVEKGAFLPLDKLIASADYPLDPGIYLPGMLAPGAWNDRQYLLPKDYSPLAVYYNKRLFDAAGLPYPQDGWTWDDFVETATALTRVEDGRTVQWGVQLPAAWTTGFEPWVAEAGGRLISEDGTRFVGYMDSPAVQKAAQFYSDLYHTYRVAPPPADINAFGGGNSEFDDGVAAMRVFGRWPQSGMLSNPNLEVGVAPLPVGDRRANVLLWGGFGISSRSEHPDEAWRFLRYYVGREGSETWKDWALPAVVSVAESSGLLRDPIEGVWIGELNNLAPRAYLSTPFWGQTAEPALRRVLETVITDPEADVAQLLATAAQDAQSALDELRRQ